MTERRRVKTDSNEMQAISARSGSAIVLHRSCFIRWHSLRAEIYLFLPSFEHRTDVSPVANRLSLAPHLLVLKETIASFYVLCLLSSCFPFINVTFSRIELVFSYYTGPVVYWRN